MNDDPIDIAWKLARTVVDEFYGRYGAQIYTHVGRFDSPGIAINFYWNRQYHWQQVISDRELLDVRYIEHVAEYMIHNMDKSMRQIASQEHNLTINYDDPWQPEIDEDAKGIEWRPRGNR